MSFVFPEINSEWQNILNQELESEYFNNLKSFVNTESAEFEIFPPQEFLFEAFKLTPFSKIRVVILGQDPYHNYGQAHGLCFSVADNTKLPPSLKNIFKELKSDLNIELSGNGNLSSWASQGVLLLNATLTVRAHEAGSHQKKGWERFTDAVIKLISDNSENVVFILWGNYAIKKTALIDSNKHLIIKSVHPSPLSASRGFFGSRPFSKTNEYLNSIGKSIINWQL